MIKSMPRTIGLNILVSDAKVPDARVIEICKDRYQVRVPNEHGAIWATNRYETEFMSEVQKPGWLASEARDARLRKTFAEWRGHIDEEACVAILRDRDMAMNPLDNSFVGLVNNANTLVSLVFSPSELRVWAGIVGPHGTGADGIMRGFDLKALLGIDSPENPPIRDFPAVSVDSYGKAWWAVWESSHIQGQGDHGRVIELLAPVLAEYPQAEGVLRLLGRSYLFQGDRARAEELFQALVALKTITEPRNVVEAWFWLGLIAQGRGDIDTARVCYQNALAYPFTDRSGDEYYLNLARQRLSSITGAPPETTASLRADPARFDGLPVQEVIVAGLAKTDEALVRSRVALIPGHGYSSSLAKLTVQRLNQLGAFSKVDVVPVPNGDGVDVVVRLEEGFGLYRDPVEFISMLGADSGLHRRVSLRYDNMGGKGISLLGSYSFANRPGSYNLALRLPSPPSLGAAIPPFVATVTYDHANARVHSAAGENEGLIRAIVVDQLSMSAEAVLSGSWSASLGGGYRIESWSDRLNDVETGDGSGRQVVGAATISYTNGYTPSWPKTGERARVSLLLSLDLGEDRDVFARLQGDARVARPLGSRMVMAAGLNYGVSMVDTPYHRRFVPSSIPDLRIQALSMPSLGFAYAYAELWHEVNPAFRIGVFAEGAGFMETLSQGSTLLKAAGAGAQVSYLAPVGVSITGYASVTPGLGARLGIKL